MTTDKTTYTTDTTEDGTEFISEISSTITETAADGTETVAEITTTAEADDPTDIDSTVTITEIAPDGTETVTEYEANEAGELVAVEEHESVVEQVVEAVFDVEIGDDASADTELSATETDDESLDVAEIDSDLEAVGADVAAGGEMFSPVVAPLETAEAPLMAESPLVTETPMMPDSSDVTYGFADATIAAGGVADASLDSSAFASSADSSTGEPDPEVLEQEAHAEAAKEAQAAADEFIEAGDYAAAAEARQVAEDESWEAGDDSMLSAYNAGDLSFAADKQEEATAYSEQQAIYAQQGDYEKAREYADEAGYSTFEADLSAGGADHTGQADAEKYNMDWAVHEEKQADYYADSAAAYAADGDFENAEAYAASAVEHQVRADDFGDKGEHGGDMAVFDPSSVVETGGSYESTFDATATSTLDTTSTYDTTSTFDATATATAVDTGFDAGVDTTTSFDPGTTDDV
jgi:hypothetical protein